MKSKRIKVVLVMLTIALLAVGGTYAYFTDIAEATNMFVYTTDIDAELYEPNWDPDKGLKIQPDTSIPKDPQIKNECQIDEYVGMKLTFRDGFGTTLNQAQMDVLLTLIDIQYYDGNNALQDGYNPLWIAFEGSTTTPVQYFYYDAILQPNVSTAPIFDVVTFKRSITNEQYAWLNGSAAYDHDNDPATPAIAQLIKGLEIYVEGAAIQSAGFANGGETTIELKTLLDTAVP
ncbi:SipW-dependent-type signal peptide-containing protein [Eubacteriales bacterium OttesenSCG-928-K08]|nr:SipW-dependent-type signal peptide-containing protein [Eubacteriales bacterium OttesenSCG-928-K08]